MKILTRVFVLLCLLLCAPHLATAKSGSFAVVELFTSEGCSSCPGADRYLSSLTKEARKLNTPLYTLSFHVDYWNYLGWKDPFSKPQFTSRQRKYAKTLRSSSVYTPQIIVNGLHGYSGNNRPKIKGLIDKYLKAKDEGSVGISLYTLDQGPTQLKVNYELSQFPQNTILNIALVERGLTIDVSRGENSGRVLGHDNVVREFRSMTVKDKTGELIMNFPKEVKRANASIIAYLQNSTSYKVIGASALDL